MLTYQASLALPSGQIYTYSGSQSLAATSTAALAAACSAMGVDISNQMVTGTALDPSFANQQATDATQD
jgi:hypothetical protein